MGMADKHQCCALVYGSDAWRSFPCSRAGTIEREGKWYCKMHDPVAKKERDDAKMAEYDTACIKRAAIDKMNRAAPAMHEALKAIVEYEANPDFSLWAKRIDAARAALAKDDGETK